MTARTVGKRYRVVSKVRFTAFLAILVVMCITMLGNAMGMNDAVSMSEEPAYRIIQVAYGDTLWGLAKTYGDPSNDIRETIYAICAINDVTADSIYPGQTLYIPE